LNGKSRTIWDEVEAELLEQTHAISVNNNIIIIIIIIYLLKKTTYSNRKASEQDRQVKLRITTLNIQYCFLYVGFE